MGQSDTQNSGWVRGWTVFKRGGWRSKVVGVFETREEAQAAAAKAGEGYEVRWGSYAERDKDFVTGDRFETV